MIAWATTEHTAPETTTTKKGNTLMHHLAAALHTLGLTLTDTAATKRTRKEGGSVTIENVLWAVAVIAIVGIVVVAITAYVTREAAKIT